MKNNKLLAVISCTFPLVFLLGEVQLRYILVDLKGLLDKRICIDQYQKCSNVPSAPTCCKGLSCKFGKGGYHCRPKIRSYTFRRAGNVKCLPLKGYPKKCTYDSTRGEKCAAEDLKSQGYFWVNREPKFGLIAGKIIGYKFIAKLEKNDLELLSRLQAKKGKCDDLKTEAPYQKCGLGESLMDICFKDEKITALGGFDPTKELNDWTDDNLRQQAYGNCQTIIQVTCETYDETPQRVCVRYMEAANNNQFDIIFMGEPSSIRDEPYDVRKLPAAIEEFKDDDQKFLKEHGKVWFFCRCHRGSNREACLNMAN